MKVLVLNDGTMEAVLVHDDWLFIRWINNDIGHLTKTLVKDFRRMESLIRGKRWKGWLMNSEKDHADMHRIIERVGGVRYSEDDEVVFFKKEISHV